MRPEEVTALSSALRLAPLDPGAASAGWEAIARHSGLLRGLSRLASAPRADAATRTATGAAREGRMVPLAAPLNAVARFLLVHVASNRALPARYAAIASLVRRRPGGQPGFEARADVAPLLEGLLPRGGGGGGQQQQQHGGRDLGVGGGGTRVYTPDDIPREYPSWQDLCVIPHEDSARPRCARRGGRAGDERAVWQAMAQAAVKDIPSYDEAVYESAINALVWEWARDATVPMRVIALHPSYNCVDVASRPDALFESRHRLVLSRLMDGDVSRVALRPGELLQLARAVLSALATLHSHGHLHLDIKPQNVLHAAARPHRREFALADFGLIAPATAVRSGALQGGSPSGTLGYISPLIALRDDTNHVHRAFHWLALVSGGVEVPSPVFEGASEKFWARYFDEHRDTALRMPPRDGGVGALAKADLHSLGLTLLAQLRSGAVQPYERLLYPGSGGALADLLPRLMFFRRGDFRSAAAALAALGPPPPPSGGGSGDRARWSRGRRG